ncbi:hypothetical protein R54767_05094 [Paraburkholderia gardini]|uniref:Uncharacterized protein n=2 Tax=Paraburkholderia gardini TaxID=2823469 RepID=A0ABM8UAW2_9BURK|nr:hypothetical protein R54767_05094 [Paraburkholderia gardini]
MGFRMQLLIVALITALSFGAMTTYLIAQLLSDDVMLKSARHGRYAYLGEDDGEATPWSSQRQTGQTVVSTRHVGDAR